MADLISREAALAILYECGGDEITPPNMVEMRGRMYKLPAVDAVEVVRCKDCEDGGKCTVEYILREVDKIPDPYCAAGKRREENAAG